MCLRNLLRPRSSQGLSRAAGAEKGQLPPGSLSAVPVCYLENMFRKEQEPPGSCSPACLTLADAFLKGLSHQNVRAGLAEERNKR